MKTKNVYIIIMKDKLKIYLLDYIYFKRGKQL